MISYEIAKEHGKTLDSICSEYSKKLNSYPKNEMGLVIEEVRLSGEYQALKRDFEKSFKELQEFNKWFLKKFKKEYLKDRQQKRFKK